MSVLYAADAVGDRHDRFESFLEFRWDDGLDFGLLLEDEAGEERGNFFGVVRRERVLEDKLGQDELVRRVDLGHASQMTWCMSTKVLVTEELTSHATRPLSNTVELSSMNLSSLRTSIRCS